LEKLSDFIRKYRDVLYALFLIMPTYSGMRAEIYVIFFLTVFFFERDTLLRKLLDFLQAPFQKKNFLVWLVAAIMLISLINKVYNGNEILCKKDYYSAFYLFPFLVLSSKLVYSERFFKFLILFTVLECIIGISEYTAGVRSFFINNVESNSITDYSLFYNSRVYGLSENSSIFSYKIFIAFILIDFVKITNVENWTYRILLLIGLLFSFSRIIILLLVLYWALILIQKLILNRKDLLKSASLHFMSVVILFCLVFFVQLRHQMSRGDHASENAFGGKSAAIKAPVSCDEIHALPMLPGELNPDKQGWGDKFMLGTNGIQSSGRKKIWLNYLNFIEKHFWFGNGSDKLMLRSYMESTRTYKLVHAHNSFLQLVATNGVLISLLYFLFYTLLFRFGNYLAIILFLLYSLGNYGIFWGFSYMDVIFLLFLNFPLKATYDYERES